MIDRFARVCQHVVGADAGASGLGPREKGMDDIEIIGPYLGRLGYGDGPPGWQAIWRGWYDIMTMVRGAEMSMRQSDAETYG